LTPNDDYNGRTAPLTSKRCILYIYSTNIGTEYFTHGIYSPFFPLQNAVCFINLTYLIPVLFAFYIQGVLKLKKKIIPPPEGINMLSLFFGHTQRFNSHLITHTEIVSCAEMRCAVVGLDQLCRHVAQNLPHIS